MDAFFTIKLSNRVSSERVAEAVKAVTGSEFYCRQIVTLRDNRSTWLVGQKGRDTSQNFAVCPGMSWGWGNHFPKLFKDGSHYSKLAVFPHTWRGWGGPLISDDELIASNMRYFQNRLEAELTR